MRICINVMQQLLHLNVKILSHYKRINDLYYEHQIVSQFPDDFHRVCFFVYKLNYIINYLLAIIQLLSLSIQSNP